MANILYEDIDATASEPLSRHLRMLMAEYPTAAARLIECLRKTTWLKQHTLVALCTDPASASGTGHEKALRHVVSFMADLHSNFDNFLDRIPMFSNDSPWGPWDASHCAASKKIGVVYNFTPPFWLLTVTEASLEKYPMKRVDAGDVQPGTVLHAVVKIITFFKDGECVIGTGVVIDEDIVVTAGHVLVSKHGHAIAVMITAGTGDTGETRYGKHAAVHGNWYAMRARANDLGFIKLDKPFDTVQPLEFEQTPITNDRHIVTTIYGFPKNTIKFAPDGQLCESKSPIQYSLFSRMIEHEGDTEEGNSGGPLINASRRIIGLHSRYGYNNLSEKVNLAVAIDHDGNNFAAFLGVINGMLPSSGSAMHHPQRNVGVTVVGSVKDIEGFVFTW